MFDCQRSEPRELLDVNLIRLDFPVLRREVHGKRPVYIDSAATSQKPQIMIDRIVEIYGHKYARMEEGHSLSREASKAFEGVRRQVASLINAHSPEEIIFCRSAQSGVADCPAFRLARGRRDFDDPS